MQASDPDADMRELAALDLESSEEKLAALRNQLRDLLLPEDKHDQLGAMLEIKAGIGGKEAASIVGLLARMYTRYSQAHSWKAVMLDSSRVEADTYKDVLLEVKGRGAYGSLKRESGVQRPLAHSYQHSCCICKLLWCHFILKLTFCIGISYPGGERGGCS